MQSDWYPNTPCNLCDEKVQASTYHRQNVVVIFHCSYADITCSSLKRASIAGVTTAAAALLPFMTGAWAATDEEKAEAAAAAAALASE